MFCHRYPKCSSKYEFLGYQACKKENNHQQIKSVWWYEPFYTPQSYECLLFSYILLIMVESHSMHRMKYYKNSILWHLIDDDFQKTIVDENVMTILKIMYHHQLCRVFSHY